MSIGLLPHACRTLGYRLDWTGVLYGEPERPNLDEPGKAAKLLEQAVQIQERIAALDPHDRFDLATRLVTHGSVVWREDPKRALALYERALATAKELASKEQFQNIEDGILGDIRRPLIRLGRLAEARKALTEELRREASDPSTQYSDRLGDIPVQQKWVSLLLAEGNRAEARKALEKTIRDTEALRASRPGDLSAVHFLSGGYRMLAAMTSGQERREALLKSAAAWHSWPATSYTKREEQKDLVAANR